MNLPDIAPDQPVLIAGPTASGKSALALEIADRHGGVIINADASQIYDCWRVITARPSELEEAQALHRLYGHVSYDTPYSAGHWMRDVLPFLNGPERPIIVGGTGLYFMTLTRGMAPIPATPPEIRATADQMSLEELSAGLDTITQSALDIRNRARVQRAWEVQTSTGRSITQWQSETPPPALNLADCAALIFDVDKDWLGNRIDQRFDLMLKHGALEEIRAMLNRYDPALPSCKAIGVPELIDYERGETDLDQARTLATIATRQFAKRQRTWFRSKMRDWTAVTPDV